jgi:D-serine deaminase-like pyridoxal phosphate-dependent protein
MLNYLPKNYQSQHLWLINLNYNLIFVNHNKSHEMLKLNVTKPTLLLDQSKCEANISRMLQRASRAQAKFRPHFKTHQSAVVGQWFRKYGISAITVSSVSMAKYFAEHGWRDICIAFPVNLLEIDQINRLANYSSLSLLVESAEVVEQLGNKLKQSLGIYIKIDVGAGRTGIPADDAESVLKVYYAIRQQPKLSLVGLLTHAGQTYAAKNQAQTEGIANEAYNKMSRLKAMLPAENLLLSWGDTPSCSLLDSMPPFDEWRPGNFVFYDVMQSMIGSCKPSEIAVAMACPVVAVHRARNQVIIYGGAVHFSKEFIMHDDGKKLYGYVVELDENGWGEPISGAYMSGMSQEHGVVNLPGTYLDTIKPGNMLGILPIHSCLTAGAVREMLTLSGDLIPCMQ